MGESGTGVGASRAEGFDALMSACKAASPCLERVLEALGLGADPNGQDDFGLSPLMALAETGGERARACARALLEAGAGVDARDVSGEGALMRACRLGDEQMARELLRCGANPNARGREGASPLAVAASYGEGLMLALLEAGSRPDCDSEDGRPLLVALCAQSQAEGPVRALLHYGVNVERADPQGWTPLCQAARSGGVGALSALLESGANPSARGPMGRSALTIALGARAPEACMGRSKVASGHARCALALLAAGAPARELDALGLPPLIRLWRALGRFEESWMNELAQAGCDCAQADSEGDGLLHWACEGEEPQALALARWAMELGALPGERNAKGRLPEERALERQSFALASLLISHRERQELLVSVGGSDEGAGAKSL